VKEQHLAYRVIVADNEPDFSEWLCSLLEKSEDFEVVGQACFGGEAIYLIVSTKPDVIIIDIYMKEIYMPAPDGLDVARYVHKHLPGIKVIVISAHEEQIYEKLAREEGALAFIPKSKLSIDALLQALREEPQL